MSYDDIIYEVNDPCAVIRLNRPRQLNAFTYHTLAEIRDAVDRASRDRAVVGIVITGEGRGFSAGLDMTVLAATTSGTDAPAPVSDEQLPGIFSYLLQVPKPVIAAINGVAAGGGVVLALMSDLRFASPDAALTTVFLKRGLVAEHGISWLLPRMVGVSRALDLLWMSDKISAAEARDIGLVDRLVTDTDVVTAACDYIARLSVTSAPKAIAASKRLVYSHLGCGYEQALREAVVVQNELVAAPDSSEGTAAFIERRDPKFERVGDRTDEQPG